MGACCSHDARYSISVESDLSERDCTVEGNRDVIHGDDGSLVRLAGSSDYVSMYGQKGTKGVNQDASTVWEDFAGEKDMIFCGVFDGHGPVGHKVSHYVRDTLPTWLSESIKSPKSKASIDGGSHSVSGGTYDDNDKVNNDKNHVPFDSDEHNLPLASWEANIKKSFQEIDEKLGHHHSIDSFCSGATAVTIVKQGEKLIIGNLGDSRAVLCKRHKRKLIPIQLTVDLKPNVPSEAERIKNCNGRVFPADEEPNVDRIWMPDEDCPGLAMTRSFGDFCLKDCGLISTPDVFYRNITKDDEFIVLATDGVWDVLTNKEVINTVASAKKPSMAAKKLVKRAVRAWKYKFPGSQVDDCTVVCLFLKNQPAMFNSSPNVNWVADKWRSGQLVPQTPMPLEKHDRQSVNSKSLLRKKHDWMGLKRLTRVTSLIYVPHLSKHNSPKYHDAVEARDEKDPVSAN